MDDDAKLVVVKTFLNRVEADLARTVLEAAEIDALVQADDAGGLETGLWMRGVRLLVRADDVRRATQVLATAAKTAGAT